MIGLDGDRIYLRVVRGTVKSRDAFVATSSKVPIQIQTSLRILFSSSHRMCLPLALYFPLTHIDAASAIQRSPLCSLVPIGKRQLHFKSSRKSHPRQTLFQILTFTSSSPPLWPSLPHTHTHTHTHTHAHTPKQE